MASDQTIRDLCAKVIAADDPAEIQAALSELKTAIREHLVKMENKGIELILKLGNVSTEVK